MKHWWNYTINKMAVTHALWFVMPAHGQIIFVFESFWLLSSVHYSWLYSMPRSPKVNLSIHVLCPGASFVLVWISMYFPCLNIILNLWKIQLWYHSKTLEKISVSAANRGMVKLKYFRTQSVTETMESKSTDKGGLLYNIFGLVVYYSS